MKIERYKKGNNTAYTVDHRYDQHNKNSYYSDNFSDEEKDKRIAHNAATTKYKLGAYDRRNMKESTIFSYIDII